MLDIMLALDGVPNVVELLEIDQSLQSVPLGKTIDEPGTMFEYPADKITCHPDIENSVGTIGQNVNIAACTARRGWPGQARP
jgi:hypothetical protein